MDNVDLKRQIEEIEKAFFAGSRLNGAPLALMRCGLTFLILAVAQLVGKMTSAGWMGAVPYLAISIVLIIAILSVMLGGSKSTNKEIHESKTKNAATHPLIRQSLQIFYSILFATLGLAIVWWQHFDRVIALSFILFGILTNLIAQFIHIKFVRASYFLIVGGLIITLASELGIKTSDVEIFAQAYLGAWTLITGFLLKKHQGN